MRPRIVLVGTGRFGNNHLRNLVELDKKRIIELVGVADTDLTRLEDVQKKYKIKTSTDYLDFINNADAFDVVTPAFTHYDIVRKLLSRKKHVFVEKPLASNFSDAAKLVKLAKENKLILQVGLIFRYNKAVESLKKLIKEKESYPYYVTGSFLQSTQPKTDVGAIFNYLHHFDILDNLFGSKIKSIFSQGNLMSKSPILETNVTVLIEFANNVNVCLNLGWIPTGKFRTLEFFSKKNHIKCDLMEQKIEIYQNEKIKKIIAQKFSEPLNLELREFVDCIINKKQPKADGNVGARVVKIAENATKSLKTKKPIKIV
jgi:UDP-N-acetylglucosamine 3-dehydrogenase